MEPDYAPACSSSAIFSFLDQSARSILIFFPCSPRKGMLNDLPEILIT